MRLIQPFESSSQIGGKIAVRFQFPADGDTAGKQFPDNGHIQRGGGADAEPLAVGGIETVFRTGGGTGAQTAVRQFTEPVQQEQGRPFH